jgi:hypothetical protein
MGKVARGQHDSTTLGTIIHEHPLSRLLLMMIADDDYDT